jgi:hypothetical protein
MLARGLRADIAGMLPAPIRAGADTDDRRPRSGLHAAKLDILKAAAGERFWDLG